MPLWRRLRPFSPSWLPLIPNGAGRPPDLLTESGYSASLRGRSQKTVIIVAARGWEIGEDDGRDLLFYCTTIWVSLLIFPVIFFYELT